MFLKTDINKNFSKRKKVNPESAGNVNKVMQLSADTSKTQGERYSRLSINHYFNSMNLVIN